MPVQPPNDDAYPSTKPNPMRNLSEYAVADTPGTCTPGPQRADYFRDDSLHCESAPAPSDDPDTNRHLPTTFGPETTQSSQGREGGMPTALERGARGSGPVNEKERRETRYVDVEQGEQRGAVDEHNDNVDAEGKMAVYAEGEVAHAVERSQRRGGSEGLSGSSSLHGRGRGEVMLEANEADLERKKQQQAAARKQVMDARKRGEDVDGRETSMTSRRYPSANIEDA
ncbi:hypothetical protein C8A03DRAFT_32349 [Achaetomium macrosporum]|uniref:Uncharacterized protein n=1 Tax=Achaetomium macrosporum TaxID=79813 RepID=A0AAN7CEP6_9PEZI|nr:hypothetical protein C8A03DRAFT_32349 [Achaetomium macrosporum]